MEIQILGCSGGVGKGLKTTTFLVDGNLLVDAGTGIELLDMQQMLAIRSVVITHAHLDHIVGLPLMLATIFDEHQHSIDIYALPDVLHALQKHIFNWTVWPDYTCLPEGKPIIRLHELNVGNVVGIAGKVIEVLPAEHPTPTVGYLVSEGEKSFAFTGDSGRNNVLWPILNERKPQLLIIDVSFTDAVEELAELSGHLTPNQFAEQISRFKHPAAIRVTHLKPGFEDEIMGQCLDLLPDRDIKALKHNELIEL